MYLIGSSVRLGRGSLYPLVEPLLVKRPDQSIFTYLTPLFVPKIRRYHTGRSPFNNE